MNKKILVSILGAAGGLILGLVLESRFEILSEMVATEDSQMSDEQKIKQVLEDFVTAWNANDPEQAALVYTDPHFDVNATPQRENRQTTAEKFRKYYETFETRIEVTSDEIIVFGDRAVQRGEFILTSTPRAGGETEIFKRRYIEVLKRDGEGNWAVYWGIDGPLAGA